MYWTLIGGSLSAFSIGLLVVLIYVWSQNHRQYRTELTFGFLCFGIALLLENLAVLYMWYMMEMMYATAAPTKQVFVLTAFFECLALVAISWVTVR